eukprot:g79501.t1
MSEPAAGAAQAQMQAAPSNKRALRRSRQRQKKKDGPAVTTQARAHTQAQCSTHVTQAQRPSAQPRAHAAAAPVAQPQEARATAPVMLREGKQAAVRDRTTRLPAQQARRPAQEQKRTSRIEEKEDWNPAPFPLVDIGVNLTNSQFRKDGPAVLRRAARANVLTIVLTGTSEQCSVRALEMARQHSASQSSQKTTVTTVTSSRQTTSANSSSSQLFATAGVHPHEASSWIWPNGDGPDGRFGRSSSSSKDNVRAGPHGDPADSPAGAGTDKKAVAAARSRGGAIGPARRGQGSAQGTEAVLRRLLLDPRVIAVGECGLDYNRDFSPRQVQLDVFRAQLQLARELGRPVFVHEREAHLDLCAVLDEVLHNGHCSPVKAIVQSPVKVVVHCFTGNAAEAAEYVRRGYYIGLTGTICKHERGAALRDMLNKSIVPLSRLMLETDAPFMGFVKWRRRSEPADVVGVAQCVADCLGRFSGVQNGGNDN